jgi:hypothetical protein
VNTPLSRRLGWLLSIWLLPPVGIIAHAQSNALAAAPDTPSAAEPAPADAP